MVDSLQQSAFIVSQGEEILTGQTIDTNANFLCDRLTRIGFRVRGVITAGDHIEEIAGALRLASERAQAVVCTGGLGPTDDDHTAQAAALAFDQQLSFYPDAMEQVAQRFVAAGRELAQSDRRQAILPEGCQLIENLLGTAPGFSLKHGEQGRCWFLPGVPSEMKAMWRQQVEPEAAALLQTPAPLRLVFRTLGKGESKLQDMLGDLPERFPAVNLGFRAHMPENQIKLVADATEQQQLNEAADIVRQRLGKDLFSESEDIGLAESVGKLLLTRGERIALAESCTGGLIGHMCVSVPGSSGWLERGFVTYSNAAKIELLGVSETTLKSHGAVSEETAIEMATGALNAASTEWGIAVTGIAGPGGGSVAKPVGSTCIAVCGPSGTRVRSFKLRRDRNSNRLRAASLALDMLRRQLLRAGQ